MDWTVVIPARVGSQGVKGKNYAEVGGKPLILHAVQAALSVESVKRVVVWTNDPTVRGIVELHHPSVEVHGRPPELDTPKATVDELVKRWFVGHPAKPTIFLQPTLYPAARFLAQAVRTEYQGWWTMVTPDDGLHWGWDQEGLAQMEARRVNRQDQGEWREVFKEVGLRICLGAETEYKAYPVTVGEWVDIDTPLDLERARAIARRPLDVLFNLIADEKHGYGHLYRCMEVANELQSERVCFTGDLDARARGILDGWEYDADREYGYPSDVTVVDRLDTSLKQMADYAGQAGAVVTFENLGPGAYAAAAVINDMYWNSSTYSGFDWTVLRPEFRGLPDYQVREHGKRVLVTMGGTDPTRSTERAIGQLAGIGLELRVIAPPGRELELPMPLPRDWTFTIPGRAFMAGEMAAADVVVCSAGRTLLETAAVGVPAVVVAQNEREATHGALHRIGWYLGPAVREPDFAGAASLLLRQVEARRQMSQATRGLIDGKGTSRIARLIRDLGSR